MNENTTCFECKHFFTERCNRDRFPGDKACDSFSSAVYQDRKQKSFAELSKRLHAMDDETLIKETLEHCRLFMLNTHGGQYLFEFMIRLERKLKRNE